MDVWAVEDLMRATIAEYLEECRFSMGSVDGKAVLHCVEVLLAAYRDGRSVYAIGNGGSASTSQHFVADLGKYATGDLPGFRAVDLTANVCSLTAWINDVDWNTAYVDILRPWLREGDVLVVFSVHGGSDTWSSNLTRAVRFAKSVGCVTLAFTGHAGGDVAELCYQTVVVPSRRSEFTIPLTEGLHVTLFHLVCLCLRRALSG